MSEIIPEEIATTCAYCGVGCGVLVKPSQNGDRAEVRGDPDHPANLGRLCSKGSALGETLTLEERLLYPKMGGVRTNWDVAIDKIASGFNSTIEQYGPESVAFYVSGQILTEDYYIANKLMKGYIGASNIDTNSRLCMASSVAGHKRAFGTDTVPGCYEDLETADLIVMVGSNLAWCHPVLHQRILAAREKRGTRLVIIDPRETATTEDVDLHLPLKPGTDVLLFNALFEHLHGSAARDDDFIAHHTNGLDASLAEAGSLSLGKLAVETELPIEALRTFFEWVEKTPETVTIYSQGVNQSSAGSDKVNAIINTHLVTGRIGKPGCGPFSVTGQPNAMGGREVGGLANQLAAHMDFEPDDIDRVGRFWSAPNMTKGPGLKAVDMFDAVMDGKIKAIWIMATNPVVSLPNANKVAEALKACPLVVVSDVVENSDTVKLADIALPATGWGEKTGTVTNSERRISRQRSFLVPAGEARHDWDAMCAIGRKMGYDGFDFDNPAQIYREYAAMSEFENHDTRDFDIGAHSQLSDADYDELKPFQWPLTRERSRPGKTGNTEHRFFENGLFYTPDRKARFVPTKYRTPMSLPSKAHPFVLNTGRIRDHWHTMTRTGKTARLSQHIAEPYLEIHPSDAEALGIKAADLVKVQNRYGKAILRALITDRVTKGILFAPMHWTDRFSSDGRVDVAIAPNVDPVSGQPELKHATVALEPFKADWYAFFASTKEPCTGALSKAEYWASSRTASGWRVELAGNGAMGAFLDDVFDGEDVLTVRSSYTAASANLNTHGVLTDILFCSSTGPVEVDRNWLCGLIDTEIDLADRMNVLSGRPCRGASQGRTICSCMGVSSAKIEEAVQAGALTIESVGAATSAGTNCGSCKPEIRAMIRDLSVPLAAAKKVAAE